MKPKEKMPAIELDLINDTKWSLDSQRDHKYSLVICYRGYHCPVCKKQLEEVASHLEEFANREIHMIAISMDSEERANKTGEEWDTKDLPIGYNMSESLARELGLFMSKGISDKEPELFSEPGLFLIDADSKLFMSSIQSMPFKRPNTKGLLNGIDYIENNDYPARGGY